MPALPEIADAYSAIPVIEVPADTSTTELRTLASYGEALGGRLETIADFGDERLAFTEPGTEAP